MRVWITDGCDKQTLSGRSDVIPKALTCLKQICICASFPWQPEGWNVTQKWFCFSYFRHCLQIMSPFSLVARERVLEALGSCWPCEQHWGDNHQAETSEARSWSATSYCQHPCYKRWKFIFMQFFFLISFLQPFYTTHSSRALFGNYLLR